MVNRNPLLPIYHSPFTIYHYLPFTIVIRITTGCYRTLAFGVIPPLTRKASRRTRNLEDYVALFPRPGRRPQLDHLPQDECSGSARRVSAVKCFSHWG